MCVHVKWLDPLYTSDNIKTLSKTDQHLSKFLLLQNLWYTVCVCVCLYIYIKEAYD